MFVESWKNLTDLFLSGNSLFYYFKDYFAATFILHACVIERFLHVIES